MRDLHQVDVAPSTEMADRLEATLLERLRATAPVASVEPGRPTASPLLDLEVRPDLPTHRPARRRLAVAVAAVVIAVTAAVALGAAQRDGVDTPIAPIDGPTTSGAQADPSDLVGTGRWGMDWDESGIDPSAPWQPGMELGAGLDFESRTSVHGSAGYGGGCEDWTAPIVVKPGGYLAIGTPTGSDCSKPPNQSDYAPAATELRRRLLLVRSFTRTESVLTLRDGDGRPVLVLDQNPYN